MHRVRRSILAITALLTWGFAIADDTPVPATSAWLGQDANNDGIRDDIAMLLASANAAASKTAGSKVADELAEAHERSASKSAQPAQSGCLSYLLLDAKDQSAANRYLQGRTHGLFGTHPCDPVISPLLERPFETDVARLDLGAVNLEYRHFE